MNDVPTICGTIRSVSYVATSRPAEWPVLTGQEHEWHVSAPGVRAFAIPAHMNLGYEERARAVIERELERRLGKHAGRSAPSEARAPAP